jgi:hypothetical protein
LQARRHPTSIYAEQNVPRAGNRFKRFYGEYRPAGSGAGVAVTVAVAFVDRFGNGRLPGSLHYNVHVAPSQPSFVTITAKSLTGFNVVLTPPSGATLAAGTFDCTVLA